MPEKAEIINASARRENYDRNVKAQIQSVTDKLLNAKLKDLDVDKSKKVSFKVSEANDEALIEETMKRLMKRMVLWVL